MKEDTVQILCGCDAADNCPQGRVGAERQCVINIPEDDLFRIVMALPEYKRRFEAMNIGDAITELRQGNRVARLDWNGPGQYLELQVPDEHSKMRKPYIYISPVDGEFVPWLASQTDILADDWVIVT